MYLHSIYIYISYINSIYIYISHIIHHTSYMMYHMHCLNPKSYTRDASLCASRPNLKTYALFLKS
jgi:hypothetical protein